MLIAGVPGGLCNAESNCIIQHEQMVDRLMANRSSLSQNPYAAAEAPILWLCTTDGLRDGWSLPGRSKTLHDSLYH